MKRLSFLLISLGITTVAFAQNIAVNANGNPADASAIFDVSSNDKGILIPRMTTPERTAIVSPAQGLMVFDTFTRSFWFYSNGWNEISNGGATGPAGGDLSGSYPSPTVAKIQNRDLSSSAPEDRQVLKWDAGANTWKAQNDSLSLPFAATLAQPGAILSITNTNTTPGATALLGKGGSGSGISPATTAGVWGDNINGLGVLGASNSGIGVYGFAQMNNGVYGYSTTAGWAGVKGSHASAGGIGVMGEIQVSGIALLGQATGTAGKAGSFVTTNATHSDTSLIVSTAGLGRLSTFNITNASNNYSAIGISHAGSGTGLKVLMSNTSANALGVDATVKGIGIAGKFVIDNATNESAAQWVTTNGIGSAAYFKKDNTTGDINDPLLAAVIIDNNSKGSALNIQSLYSPSNNSALYVNYGGDAYGFDVHSTGKAVHAIAPGDKVMLVENSATGTAIEAIGHGSNAPTVLSTNTDLHGVALKGISASPDDDKGAITGLNDSVGVAVYGEAYYGIGVKGVSHSTTLPAIYGVNGYSGVAVEGEVTDQFGTAVYGHAPQNVENCNGVVGEVSGTGSVGVLGIAGSDGTGILGTDGAGGYGAPALFHVKNHDNVHSAVTIYNDGSGPAMLAFNTKTSSDANMLVFSNDGTGNFAIFEHDYNHMIRFDITGKGYFEGGTQTGGADVAEAFDVESETVEYEPGDVLVISTEADRTVTKSNRPYSNLVAGVYATKPGVLMTEEQIDMDLADKVPMGVIGVIPTKVCGEGGPVHRGDLLVTSSIPGVAMKADSDKVKPGQVLGRALEEYTSEGTGKIRVLVNVR